MATYLYRARNRARALFTAKVDAPSAHAVAQQLLESQLVPIEITPVLDRAPLRMPFTRDKVTLDDLIILCRQMFTLTRSGIPILRGLTALSETTRNPKLRTILKETTDSLRSGRELSDGFSKYRETFSPLFLSVLQVGENTGRLDESFRQMGDYLEFDRETGRRIKTATRYPMFVMGAVGMAMIVINLFVIPAFAKVFANFDAELPWATRVLIGTSEFMIAYWPQLLILSVGGTFAVLRYLQTDQGRLLWDRFKLKIPAIGSILERSTMARYARAVTMTWSAGVPAVEALEVVARATGNHYIGTQLLEMRISIERGDSLTRAANACGIFTPLVLQMIPVGEETGQVAEMHTEIANTYESEVEYDLSRLSETIEPILIVFMGVVVLILALGVYLPMWDLSTAMKPGG